MSRAGSCKKEVDDLLRELEGTAEPELRRELPGLEESALIQLRHGVCPPVTGEQLLNLAYFMLAADPLSPPGTGVRHRGSPDVTDQNGQSKRMVYQAVVEKNVEFFTDLAKAWNKGTWHNLILSTRTLKWNRGKARPIDVSSEALRLLSAWVLLHVDELVQQKKWLPSTVVGFRHLHEFPPYGERRDGVTIQDVYASAVWKLVREYGPWIVLLDQRDAFGNLPHRAVQEALKELGLNHRERRILIELVRVRTVVKGKDGGEGNSRILKPKGYGIEQGNYLSPMVFNIVQAHLTRLLQDQGVKSAAYGDDIIFVAHTEEEAHRAFEVYDRTTKALGYKNTRGFNDPEKPTRILDTRIEQAPLIKTFLVGRGQIALAAEKAKALLDLVGGKKDLSLRKLRRKNQWRVVSKKFLKNLLSGPLEEDSTQATSGQGMRPEEVACQGPAARACNDPQDLRPELPDDDPSIPPYGEMHGGSVQVDVPIGMKLSGVQDADGDIGLDSYGLGSGIQDIRSLSRVDDPYGERVGNWRGPRKNSPSDLLLCSSYQVAASDSTIPASRTAGSAPAGGTTNGKVSALRGGPEARVHSGLGVEGGGHLPSTPNTVLLEPVKEDLADTGQGRRLRAGDRYRRGDARVVVDLREFGGAVPQGRLAHAVGQLARAASRHGLVRFLVHPGDQWVHDADVWLGLHETGRQEAPEGIVVTFRREPTTEKVPSKGSNKKATPPPETDLTIVRVRMDHDVRQWVVTIRVGEVADVVRVAVTSPNRTIGRLEAIAAVLGERMPETVAIPTGAPIRQALRDGTRPRQVALYDAVEILCRWTWTEVPGFVVGRRAA